MDVDALYCSFQKELTSYLTKKMYGAECSFPTILRRYVNYIHILESNCTLSEDMECRIKKFFDENVGTYTPFNPSTSVNCNITANTATVLPISCPSITATIL